VSDAEKGRVLASEDWLPRRDRHQDRVDALLDNYLRQRAHGRPHPVVDFLFTYYRLTPGQLRRWHPGFGVTLTGGESHEYASLRGYAQTAAGVTVCASHLARRRPTVDYVVRLMEAVAGRPAQLSCFGMHEWAMVYRADSKQLRHSLPLRLGQGGTDAVVESIPLRCTHFDAFRFFTDSARPRNMLQLSRADQLVAEQPGCIHAAMDVYKFAGKLLPLIDSELLMDAFELAHAARELDMCASPYDLRAFGYEPVRVESAGGRAEYVRRQADLMKRATGVRSALLARSRELLTCR
jgi:hypothetical protein